MINKQLSITSIILALLTPCITAPLSHGVLTGEKWEVLEDVELIDNHNYDGDSFRIRNYFVVL